MTSAVDQNLVVLKDELAHGKAESKVMPYVARDETVRLGGTGVRDDTGKVQLIWFKEKSGHVQLTRSSFRQCQRRRGLRRGFHHHMYQTQGSGTTSTISR